MGCLIIFHARSCISYLVDTNRDVLGGVCVVALILLDCFAVKLYLIYLDLIARPLIMFAFR